MKEYVCIEKELFQKFVKSIDDLSVLLKSLRATSQTQTTKYKIIDLED